MMAWMACVKCQLESIIHVFIMYMVVVVVVVVLVLVGGWDDHTGTKRWTLDCGWPVIE